MKRITTTALCALAAILFAACNNSKKTTAESERLVIQTPVGPTFNADSAYSYCAAQCDFGPRVMNSTAHDKCEDWIASKFEQFGCTVIRQKADLTGFDGTTLRSTNIIASYKPELAERIMLCAHWDSRPWADNDPDEANWKKPVDAANDGASGVAVMLEIARAIQNDTLGMGVDFICFDAEDWGVPQWSDVAFNGDTWALGSNYWSMNPHKTPYYARFGILFDMVGGQGAKFPREGMSKQFAPDIVDKVWTAAEVVGYGSYFPKSDGTSVTDDHVPVNKNAKIPTIDIIPYYPDCQQSSFGPTWHTINDTMDNIDKDVLKAVGQTVIQVIYSEALSM